MNVIHLWQCSPVLYPGTSLHPLFCKLALCMSSHQKIKEQCFLGSDCRQLYVSHRLVDTGSVTSQAGPEVLC